MKHRLVKLKKIIQEKGLGAFLVSRPINVYYLSGLKTDTSSLLVTKNENIIMTDFRYKEDACEIPGFRVELVDADFKDALKNILRGLGIKSLGFEANHLSYCRAAALKELLKKQWIRFEPVKGAIEGLRIYKDEAEIHQIRRCLRIAGKALGELKGRIRSGATEKGLSVMLESLIRSNGGDGCAFDSIIASGKNSSRPHANLTGRALEKNDHVLIDFGVRSSWYNCDLTRVFFLGRIQRILKNMYSVCLEAQRRVIAIIKPGIPVSELDRLGRDYISSRKYGDCFGHSIGHGIGLDIHEAPSVSSREKRILQPNMVFSIEPGIYMEGAAGVRIEDMILVTEKGCEVLSDDIPK